MTVLGSATPTAQHAPAPAFSPGGRRGAWKLTTVATVAATYALDAAATAAGVLLVASGLLDGLDGLALLAFLAATYVAWGAGLRVNLAANWTLLCQTGASTNLLSKAAHDLARTKGLSVRARRAAASVGYVATELAKEAPYYVGASGIALFSDGLSSSDALVFLAGANVGAAAYEYGLARATRTFLRRRTREERYASFDHDWVPGEYLADYYAEVEPDEHETIAFFVDEIRRAEPGTPVLFYGVGPTLHHVFLAAERASEIHLADYLPANLREIELWLAGSPAAHDWRPFVAYTLTCEGVRTPTAAQIDAREALTRSKITRLLRVDAREAQPVGTYATVVSAYCADSATADRATWETYLQHIAGAVEPEGLFVTSALRRCGSYLVGGKPFPAANVDEHDVRGVLEAAFAPSPAAVSVRRLAGNAAKGYSSIVLATARAPAARS